MESIWARWKEYTKELARLPEPRQTRSGQSAEKSFNKRTHIKASINSLAEEYQQIIWLYDLISSEIRYNRYAGPIINVPDRGDPYIETPDYSNMSEKEAENFM